MFKKLFLFTFSLVFVPAFSSFSADAHLPAKTKSVEHIKNKDRDEVRSYNHKAEKSDSKFDHTIKFP